MADKSFTDILTDFVPAVALAAITAYVTVRLSLRQFRSERWWEKKAESYSRIVEALNSAMEYCDAMEHQSLTGDEIRDEKKARLHAEYEEAVRDLRKATAIGAYLVSEDATVVLKELLSRPKLDWRTTAPFEFYGHEHDGYADALGKIRRLAKKDLRIKKGA